MLNVKLREIYEEVINEWQSEHGYKEFIPFLEDILKIKVGSKLHSGTMSDVFNLSGGKVLKMTSDGRDVQGMLIAMKNPKFPIPKVFQVYKIDSNIVNKSSRFKGAPVWVIISEKVKPITADENQVYDLKNWFEKNTKYYPNDIHPQNIGIDSTGRPVYLDPSFANADTNPLDVETLK